MKELNEIIQHLKMTIEDVSLGNVTQDIIQDDSVLLDDLGLDSLDYASVMLAGETFVGRKVNENGVNWREVRTVKQLAELIYRCQS